MNELFNTLKDIILHFLPYKEKESEALDKFISAANQEKQIPYQPAYYFARATGHRYATGREVQLIMNTRNPLMTIWMYKNVNRSQSVVRFNDDGQAEVTDRAGYLTRGILLIIDIIFSWLFLVTASWALNDTVRLLNAVKNMTVTATLMLNSTVSVLAAIILAFILLMTAFVWRDVLNARYFADYYNANRCQPGDIHTEIFPLKPDN